MARLDFQVCHPCLRGYVEGVAAAVHRQGEGSGRDLVHAALASHPDAPAYAWSTSRQSSQRRAFFAILSQETGVDFPAGEIRCPHMVSAQPRAGLLYRLTWGPSGALHGAVGQ